MLFTYEKDNIPDQVPARCHLPGVQGVHVDLLVGARHVQVPLREQECGAEAGGAGARAGGACGEPEKAGGGQGEAEGSGGEAGHAAGQVRGLGAEEG